MKPYQVYFKKPLVDTKTLMQPDAYEFKPIGRWGFLQKQAWKFLMKTKALRNATYDRQTISWTTVEPDKVIDYVLTQIDHCWDRYSDAPIAILMGAEDYRRIASGVEADVEFQMTCELRQYNTFLGVKVQVVPWIKGIIVLPKGVV